LKMCLHLLREMQGFMFSKSEPTFFHCLHFSPFVDGSTLFYRWMIFAHWLIPLKQTWYHMQFFPMGWLQ
jgi:hypothetical protein